MLAGKLTLGSAFLLLASLLVGCGPSAYEKAGMEARSAYYAGEYEKARQVLKPFETDKGKDYVLTHCRLGSCALAMGRLDLAEAYFLKAYEVVNSYGVNSTGRAVGAVTVDESVRVWKGEPYERAMLNFDLGLVYYLQGEYNNARAAFENALFKLREYKDVKDESKFSEADSNFAVAHVMLARCHQQLGNDDKMRLHFDKARALRPDLASLCDPAVHAQSNVLLIVEWGEAPRKDSAGDDGSQIVFSPSPAGAGAIPRLQVRTSEGPVGIGGLGASMLDTVGLAADRKWQSIDTIRTVKSAVGTGMVYGGAAVALLSDNRDTQLIGLGVAAIGMLIRATSQADTRHWEMLPRGVFIVPMSLPPGTHSLHVSAGSDYRYTFKQIEVPVTKKVAVYARMIRWVDTGAK